MAGSCPYRDGSSVVRARLEEHRSRLAALDAAGLDGSSPLPRNLPRNLPRKMRRQLLRLRRAAEPRHASAPELARAEEAALEYERRIELAADLGRLVEPWFPSRSVLLFWSRFAALSVLLLVFAVMELGLGDFMLQAFGVRVVRLTELAPDRVAYEAQMAAQDL